MTRCLIRKDFFDADSFRILLKNPEDMDASLRQDSNHENRTLIEFCLPFTELKHIVESMLEEDNSIELVYPCGDNMLEIRIPEESKGIQDKVITETSIQLETYEATHTLDADYSFKSIPIAAEIYGRVHHFKRALREFNFLEPTDVVSIETNEKYPKLQFVFRSAQFKRY